MVCITYIIWVLTFYFLEFQGSHRNILISQGMHFTYGHSDFELQNFAIQAMGMLSFNVKSQIDAHCQVLRKNHLSTLLFHSEELQIWGLCCQPCIFYNLSLETMFRWYFSFLWIGMCAIYPSCRYCRADEWASSKGVFDPYD